MCQTLCFLMILGLSLVLTDGESITSETIPGLPLDGAAVAPLDLQNTTGLADCKEDTNPTLCDSSTISEDCQKNLVVKQSCQFSCSLSGQLWQAALKGSLEEVNAAIAGGANPLCHNTSNVLYDKRTAIHVAALGNHPRVIKALLEAGVDVDLHSTQGITPTYYAAQNGSIDALNMLIGHNANVNLAGFTNTTPLMAAAGRGHWGVAEALINANASIDVTGGGWNTTALYYAVYKGNQDIALLLIEHNANVNIAVTGGYTPLMIAAQKGQLDVAKALISANVNVNIAASNGYTPLMAAAQEGQLDVAKALISANASIDATGGWLNATALYYAVYSNNEDIVLLLIEHNANVNIANSDVGLTPLMLAIVLDQLSDAKALINANASLDATDRLNCKTALHWAAMRPITNNKDATVLLIESGASLDLTDIRGNTPLHEAALRNNKDIAVLLMKSGAYAMMSNNDGDKPSDQARINGHNQLADLIERYTDQCRFGEIRHKWC